MKKRPKKAPSAPKPMDSLAEALAAHNALVDHRALDPVILDMREVTPITDFFLLCSGTSDIHIRSLSDAVVEALEELGIRAHNVEGYQGARWVLLDYGDFVVHVFSAEDREFYSLERLWSDAPAVTTPHTEGD